MNRTLEEIAKAIFKSWFVDFDPVRAKATCQPTGLPSDISDLFPDELVESELGQIPKGWEITPLSEFINLERVCIQREVKKVLGKIFWLINGMCFTNGEI